MDYKKMLTRFYNASKQKVELLENENERLEKKIKEIQEQAISLKQDKNTVIDYFEKEIELLKEEVRQLKEFKISNNDAIDISQDTIELQQFIEAQRELTKTNKRNKISMFLEVMILILLGILLVIQLLVIL